MRIRKAIRRKLNRGFSVIEIVLLIAILVILAIVVYVAINPAKLLKDAGNARRQTDVDSIAAGVHSYMMAHNGALPEGLTRGMLQTQLGRATTGCTITTGSCLVKVHSCVDISQTVGPYIKSMPVDPATGNSTKTDYAIAIEQNGAVTVKACGAEDQTTISATQ